MNSNCTISLLLFLSFISCNNKEELFLNPESFTEAELKICKKDSCPEITINYVMAIGDETISKKINSEIEKFIISALMLGEESDESRTIKGAAINFISAYRDDMASFPDMSAGYVAEISVNEIYRSTDLLCLEMSQYFYTGGAHGYGTTSFKNINLATGDEFTEKELFKNKKGFAELAEQKFRKQQHIPQNASINESGFWFENNTFQLSENIGFLSDSLILVYNQYDIASYAEGPIELKIALKEAAPFLQVK